jgi:hypothetical protein
LNTQASKRGTTISIPAIDKRYARLSKILFIIKYSISVFCETFSMPVQRINSNFRQSSFMLAGSSPTKNLKK